MKVIAAALFFLVMIPPPAAADDSPTCDGPVEPFPESAPTDGAIRLRLRNEGTELSLHSCAFGSGGKRFDEVFKIPGGAVVEREWTVPSGEYDVWFQATWHDQATAGFYMDLNKCDSGRMLGPVNFTTVGPAVFMGLDATECLPAPVAAPAEPTSAHKADVPARPGQAHRLPIPISFAERDRPWLAGGLVGLAVMLAGAWKLAGTTWVFGLYSRLLGPRLLNHPVRAQLVELVRHEPGVNLNEAARRLELSQDVIRHHIGILLGAGILREQRVGRRRFLFLSGPLDPTEVETAVLLRRRSAQLVMDAMARTPGATLTEIAAVAGVSLPTASKVAAQLLRVRLARRDDTSGTSHWWAVGASPAP